MLFFEVYMKTYFWGAVIFSLALSVSAFVTTSFAYRDPIRAAGHTTAHIANGVGGVAVGTWNGAVHGTSTAVRHSTKAVVGVGKKTERHVHRGIKRHRW